MTTTFTPDFIAAQLALAELAEVRIARAVDEVIANYPDALREIQRMREENERLRAALTWYAENTDVLTDPNGKRAREALKGGEK